MITFNVVWHFQWAYFLFFLTIATEPSFSMCLLAWICGASAFAHFYRCITVDVQKRRLLNQGVRDFVLGRYAQQSVRHSERLQKFADNTLDSDARKQVAAVLRTEELQLHTRIRELTQALPQAVTSAPAATFIVRIVVTFLGADKLLDGRTQVQTSSAACPVDCDFDCHLCTERIAQGCPIAVLRPCNHIIHERCWMLWALQALACPVCGQADAVDQTWLQDLLKGDCQTGLASLQAACTPFYWHFLPSVRTAQWRTLMRVYWLTAVCQRSACSALGLSYALSLAILAWRCSAPALGWLLGALYVGAAVLNAGCLELLLSGGCRRAEPALHATMRDLREQ
eukprot:EG_transcript_18869